MSEVGTVAKEVNKLPDVFSFTIHRYTTMGEEWDIIDT